MSINDPQLNRPQIYPARLLEPLPVPCPNCGQKVQGFASCKVEDDSVPGKKDQKSRAVTSTPIRARMTWSLYPCYCKVDHYWAGNFSDEMSRRDRGEAPHGVTGLSKAERAARKKEIEGRITALYKKREAAASGGMTSRTKALERDIVIQIQELCVLLPGAHNTLPPLNLSKDVAEWAGQNNLKVPPGNSQNLSSGHAQNITFHDIRILLAVDPDYQGMPAGMIASAAKEIYDQLAAYVANGTPMHTKSIAAIAKLIPGADSFLPAKEVNAADDPDPRIAFARQLSARAPRKMVKLRKKKTEEDID